TSVSLTISYLVILAAFTLPFAIQYFVGAFVVKRVATAAGGVPRATADDTSTATEASVPLPPTNRRAVKAPPRQPTRLARQLENVVYHGSLTSPFSAVHSLPLEMENERTNVGQPRAGSGGWSLFFSHILFTLIFNIVVLGAIIWLFNVRWRVSY
ncbi:MAG: hypothetical protein VX257_00695, partial [Planctomycetota bacterium]|nr:hypothetical protein [Planctomycetota bacterium]